MDELIFKENNAYISEAKARIDKIFAKLNSISGDLVEP